MAVKEVAVELGLVVPGLGGWVAFLFSVFIYFNF